MLPLSEEMDACLGTPPRGQSNRRAMSHREMYKKGSKSCDWKDSFRQRCQERMSANRDKLFEARRMSGSTLYVASVLDEIIKDEMRRFRASSTSRRTLFGKEEDPEEFMEDLRRELALQEQEMLQEYEQGMNQVVSHLQSNEVFCPACHIRAMQQGMATLTCECGFTIPCQLSLEEVSTIVNEKVDEHSARCSCIPNFTACPPEDPGIIMVCSGCGYCTSVV